jgi:cell division protein FtsQ
MEAGMSFARSRVALGSRPRLLRSRRRLRHPFRLLAAAACLTAVIVGGWLWFRDSSFVAATQVTVAGEAGPDAAGIRSALQTAARGMSTLDVQMGRLRGAVSAFREIKRLQVSTQFPHRILIRVIEQLPVGFVQAGGREIPVAGDGTLLRTVRVTASLPLIPLTVPPVGSHLTERDGASAVALLAAAPYRLLTRVSQVTTVAGHGLVAHVRGGPSIYFGNRDQLRAKWIAASQVLGDSGSGGAVYIDVSDPARPAVGGGVPVAAGTGSLGSGSATASSTASPGSAPGPTGAASPATTVPAGPGTTTTGG